MASKMRVSRVYLHRILCVSPKPVVTSFHQINPAAAIAISLIEYFACTTDKILVFERGKTGAIKGHLYPPQREEVSGLRDAL